MIYAGDCGRVCYPAQLQIVATRVLCKPAKRKSQIKTMVLSILKLSCMHCMASLWCVFRKSLKCTPGRNQNKNKFKKTDLQIASK